MGNTISFTAVRAIGNGIATLVPTYTSSYTKQPSAIAPKQTKIITESDNSSKVYEELV